MNKTSIVIASATLAIAALATVLLVRQRPDTPQPNIIKSAGAVTQPTVVEHTESLAEVRQAVSANPPEVASASVSKIDPSLSEKAEAVEFLGVLEHHRNMGLSQSEIGQMLNVYLRIREKQSAHEVSIATVTTISPAETFIEVPKYALAGERLRAEMYQQFSEIVGANRIEPIKQAISGELYMRSFGWGESDQEILISRKELPIIGRDHRMLSTNLSTS